MPWGLGGCPACWLCVQAPFWWLVGPRADLAVLTVPGGLRPPVFLSEFWRGQCSQVGGTGPGRAFLGSSDWPGYGHGTSGATGGLCSVQGETLSSPGVLGSQTHKPVLQAHLDTTRGGSMNQRRLRGVHSWLGHWTHAAVPTCPWMATCLSHRVGLLSPTAQVFLPLPCGSTHLLPVRAAATPSTTAPLCPPPQPLPGSEGTNFLICILNTKENKRGKYQQHPERWFGSYR